MSLNINKIIYDIIAYIFNIINYIFMFVKKKYQQIFIYIIIGICGIPLYEKFNLLIFYLFR